MGSSHQVSGSFHVARASFKKAYVLYRRLNNFDGQLKCALSVGDMERQLENFTSARHSYQTAQKLSRTLNDHQAHTDALTGEALAWRGHGRYEKSICLLRETLRFYRKQRDREGTAYTYWALGTTQRFAGSLKEAEKNLRLSVRMYSALSDPLGLAYARCGLGGTLRMRGQFSQSGRLYKMANQTFSKLGDKFGLAYSFCGQGNALRMRGRIKQSIPFMNKAAALYRSIGQKGPLGFVLWSRAQVEMALGRLPRAENFLREARRLFQKVHDTRGLEYCRKGQAELLRLKKSPDSKAILLP